MPNLAANLSMMFQEIGFLDRFDAAARAGFKGVEFLFPYEHPPEVIAEKLERNGLKLGLFNTVPGDWSKNERGLAAQPGREAEFRAGVDKAITYAKAAKCPNLHTMAGLWPAGRDKAEGERVYIENLRWAADRMAPEGLNALIEPINTRDIPGYFLNYTQDALRIIEKVKRPNLKLQLDLYHVQIMEGDLATHIRDLAGHYPHVQIAGNPGRNEPDVGEINYPFLFDLFDEIGYTGWIGCEYRPKGDTVAGLGWARKYGIGG
ncbi:MAG: hydroxypyruvate isomerase family protein [Alphaproteobacteria bacterium]|nr:hydroxypyruvate isomerase family protein [Alphaproteobacteria bacterium]